MNLFWLHWTDVWLGRVWLSFRPLMGWIVSAKIIFSCWDFSLLECISEKKHILPMFAKFIICNSSSRIVYITFNFWIPHHSRSCCRLYWKFLRSFDPWLWRWWLTQMWNRVSVAHKGAKGMRGRRDDKKEPRAQWESLITITVPWRQQQTLCGTNRKQRGMLLGRRRLTC